MVNEFGNCTDDSSDGGFSHEEGAGPSNVPDREARNDSGYGDDDDDNDGGGSGGGGGGGGDVGSDDSDGDYNEDPEEYPGSDGDKTQEKGVIHEG